MFDVSEYLGIPPYSLSATDKNPLYVEALSSLTQQHSDSCSEYKRIIRALGFDPTAVSDMEDFPFLPVRLFKEYELLSVDRSEVIKTMTSSGTSGQRVSKIFLDRDTALNQTKVLAKIASSFLGPKRLPMLIIDAKNVIRDRNLFSARGAGILGFSTLGYDPTYALDDQMNLDMDAVNAFLEKHAGAPILVFGFTFMIWAHFILPLLESSGKIDISTGIMIHGGGWKTLLEQAVDGNVFKQTVEEACGVTSVFNYYGMVEQTGSIFMECDCGSLHASLFSDVIIRNPQNFEPMVQGEQGLIQLVSLLPKSYPGHSILTEDLGIITGEDDCPCGRMGKCFKVNGRVKDAEIRGCSDAYASH